MISTCVFVFLRTGAGWQDSQSSWARSFFTLEWKDRSGCWLMGENKWQVVTNMWIVDCGIYSFVGHLEERLRGGPVACHLGGGGGPLGGLESCHPLARELSSLFPTESPPYFPGSKENTYFFPIFRRRHISDLNCNLIWVFGRSNPCSPSFHTWVVQWWSMFISSEKKVFCRLLTVHHPS